MRSTNQAAINCCHLGFGQSKKKKSPTSLRVSEIFKLPLIWRLDYWAAAAHPLTFFIHNKYWVFHPHKSLFLQLPTNLHIYLLDAGWMDGWILGVCPLLQFSSMKTRDNAILRRRLLEQIARASSRASSFLLAAMFGKKTDFPLRRRVAALILLAHEFPIHAHRFEQLQAYIKSMNLG